MALKMQLATILTASRRDCREDYWMKIESQYLVDGRKTFEQFPFNGMDYGLLNSRVEASHDSLFLRI